MPDVVSKPGDCISSIAREQGFFNYISVYSHADNATRFPNPNQVEEGSTVKVPEKEMKAFDMPLDVEKKFKIVRKKTKLAVRLCTADSATTPAIAKATLECGGKKVSNTSGTLEIDDIDPTATSATLTVVLSKPPAHAAPPATSVGVANQHPPPIVPADFDDPATVWLTKGTTFVWQLGVGYLEPSTATRGVLQRLVNLGHACPASKSEDDASRRAVRCYRRFVEGKAAPADTSSSADIATHVGARHDDPP